MMTRLIVLAMAFLVSIAQAQAPNGEIHLEIKDPSGKALEASGKLESLSTGASRSFQSDAQGIYRLENLPYGRYRLEVFKDGFAPRSILIDVRSATPISRFVTMDVGSLAFKVEVVGTTPLPGSDLEPNEIPAPTQTATHRDIDASGALAISDFMNRRFSSVHVNEMQGNPYQSDVNYRGYTASPLLGTPQGLSVYLDGVRLNQPFGDVLSWDLIPRVAISEVALMPGSNPLFGLNTLGGALSIQTKDGRRQPGNTLELSGGSFGRAMIDFEHGGVNSRGLNWYLASSLFFDDGWRENSSSNVRQFFGKISQQYAKTILGLTVSYANNSLTGNGLQEQRFIARDYKSIYTKPDITDNRSPFLNFSARHSVSNNLTFSGNVYYRSIRTNTLNADINEDSLDQSLYQPSAAERAALTAAGYTGFPSSGASAANTPFPFWRCIGQALLQDEPAEKCNGLINRANSRQQNYGASGQMTLFSFPRGRRNQFTAGAAYDRSNVDFRQSTQLGYLNPDRSVTGVNAFADGVTGGDVDGAPYDARVDLHGMIHTGSVFATDTLAIGAAWVLTFAGRYNRTTIDNSDRITPGGGPGSLDGTHVFDRFNPAVGVIYRPTRVLNAYLNYSEGSRAPTSVELGCADPDQPCKLPNAMAGDPPLKQVVTRTFEAGLRGGWEDRLNWNAGWFQADNHQDILFVASEQTGFGYFRNFGKTRRRGLEINLNSRFWRVSLDGGYTFLDATYQSPELVGGSSNSANNMAATARGLEGLIGIQPGAQIPLIPQHMLKVFANIQATTKFSIDLGVVGLSSSYARGNENNLHQPDGLYYLGPGKAPGYAVVNFGARFRINRRLELFARINNLFDRRYYTAAQLGPTGFTDAGAFIARPLPAVDGEFPVTHATFYAPGAPRGAWGGLRLQF